ncbi:Druantia anti-phage system protein DruA [Hymenobacter daecheongensis]|nr:Druantia anti-phage system protein DruA [Hymenobacter daecheongensis]
MYELTPKLPSNAAIRRLWAVLAKAPLPTVLADYLRGWLSMLNDEALPHADYLRLRVFGRVLMDLASQGWHFSCASETATILRALSPDTTVRPGQTATSPAEVKQVLRASLVANRDEQLRDPDNQRFIRRMELPRRHAGRMLNVRNLLVNPRTLAAELQTCLAAPEANRAELIGSLVQPYLQLATEAVDEHTGLRLLDIWRYCRYTWSLPFQTQPGRRMFYLVRDAARPLHPIIGIGALGSAVVQITVRDEYVGWSVKSLQNCADPTSRLRALDFELARAVDEIFAEDFVEEGILELAELVQPTAATFDNLDRAARDLPVASRTAHRGLANDLEAEARSDLYRRKRAETLSGLLSARQVFQQSDHLPAPERLAHLLASPEGLKALRIAIKSIKKRHVAASIMEITTCGAIPPYGELLGGKLVAMLMASPQVVAEYKARYTDSSSVIASRMRGEIVNRDANLVLLGTSSLYHVGSSQYNRIKFPTAKGEIEYKLIGKTEGFGSVHLSRQTYDVIQEMLREDPAQNSQSYTFAAGVNYKLRSIASAFNMLGLQKLQKHATPRLVYLTPTAKNWQRYLLGEDQEPEWLFSDLDNYVQETAAIVEHWKQRWFIKRAQNPEIVARLLTAEKIASLTQITDHETEAARKQQGSFFFLGDNMPPKIDWSVFALFNGGRTSFAEKLKPAELEIFHIESKKLEAGILGLLNSNRRVYLTGNPGDGKTHLIRRLSEDNDNWPSNTFVHWDASAENQEKLVAELKQAIIDKRPVLVAVNEGPLRQILLDLPESEASMLREQLATPFVYDAGTVDEPEIPEVLLVHLGSRQVLTHELLEKALQIALRKVDYDSAPERVRANVQALGHHLVQQRLGELLKLVSQGGTHVTMHQLLGLLARMITGGSPLPARAQNAHPYYEAIFEKIEGSALSATLRELDPARSPHAHLDTHKLWDSPASAGQWLTSPAHPAPGSSSDKDEAVRWFRSLKRQYYFEATQGKDLLKSIPPDRASFADLVSGGTGQARRKLLTALARFANQKIETGTKSHDGSSNATAPELYLWTSLRYDAVGPATALIAAASLRETDVAVQLPSLSPALASLLDYEPDHVRLTLSRKAGAPALLLDLELWTALGQVSRGLPLQFRSEEAGRRVGRFLSELAAFSTADETGKIRIHDVEAGHTYAVGLEAQPVDKNGHTKVKYVL